MIKLIARLVVVLILSSCWQDLPSEDDLQEDDNGEFDQSQDSGADDDKFPDFEAEVDEEPSAGGSASEDDSQPRQLACADDSFFSTALVLDGTRKKDYILKCLKKFNSDVQLKGKIIKKIQKNAGELNTIAEMIKANKDTSVVVNKNVVALEIVQIIVSEGMAEHYSRIIEAIMGDRSTYQRQNSDAASVSILSYLRKTKFPNYRLREFYWQTIQKMGALKKICIVGTDNLIDYYREFPGKFSTLFRSGNKLSKKPLAEENQSHDKRPYDAPAFGFHKPNIDIAKNCIYAWNWDRDARRSFIQHTLNYLKFGGEKITNDAKFERYTDVINVLINFIGRYNYGFYAELIDTVLGKDNPNQAPAVTHFLRSMTVERMNSDGRRDFQSLLDLQKLARHIFYDEVGGEDSCVLEPKGIFDAIVNENLANESKTCLILWSKTPARAKEVRKLILDKISKAVSQTLDNKSYHFARLDAANKRVYVEDVRKALEVYRVILDELHLQDSYNGKPSLYEIVDFDQSGSKLHHLYKIVYQEVKEYRTRLKKDPNTPKMSTALDKIYNYLQEFFHIPPILDCDIDPRASFDTMLDSPRLKQKLINCISEWHSRSASRPEAVSAESESAEELGEFIAKKLSRVNELYTVAYDLVGLGYKKPEEGAEVLKKDVIRDIIVGLALAELVYRYGGPEVFDKYGDIARHVVSDTPINVTVPLNFIVPLIGLGGLAVAWAMAPLAGKIVGVTVAAYIAARALPKIYNLVGPVIPGLASVLAIVPLAQQYAADADQFKNAAKTKLENLAKALGGDPNHPDLWNTITANPNNKRQAVVLSLTVAAVVAMLVRWNRDSSTDHTVIGYLNSSNRHYPELADKVILVRSAIAQNLLSSSSGDSPERAYLANTSSCPWTPEELVAGVLITTKELVVRCINSYAMGKGGDRDDAGDDDDYLEETPGERLEAAIVEAATRFSSFESGALNLWKVISFPFMRRLTKYSPVISETRAMQALRMLDHLVETNTLSHFDHENRLADIVVSTSMSKDYNLNIIEKYADKLDPSNNLISYFRKVKSKISNLTYYKVDDCKWTNVELFDASRNYQEHNRHIASCLAIWKKNTSSFWKRLVASSFPGRFGYSNYGDKVVGMVVASISSYHANRLRRKVDVEARRGYFGALRLAKDIVLLGTENEFDPDQTIPELLAKPGKGSSILGELYLLNHRKLVKTPRDKHLEKERHLIEEVFRAWNFPLPKLHVEPEKKLRPKRQPKPKDADKPKDAAKPKDRDKAEDMPAGGAGEDTSDTNDSNKPEGSGTGKEPEEDTSDDKGSDIQ